MLSAPVAGWSGSHRYRPKRAGGVILAYHDGHNSHNTRILDSGTSPTDLATEFFGHGDLGFIYAATIEMISAGIVWVESEQT